jgi:hypothetical protein
MLKCARKTGEHQMHSAFCGILADAAVGIVAHDYYDKKTNFQPVSARVSAVNEQ